LARSCDPTYSRSPLADGPPDAIDLHRLRLLMVRDFLFAPKGQTHTSPGQRPRTTEAKYMPQAVKGRHRPGGRHVSRGPVAPRQGFADWCRSWVPRALPWADMWLPLRGDGRPAQLQDSRFGLAKGRGRFTGAQRRFSRIRYGLPGVPAACGASDSKSHPELPRACRGRATSYVDAWTSSVFCVPR
jgi:hypothetical protein